MVVVDEIEYIINQGRERGNVEIIGGVAQSVIPCNVVFDCDGCLQLADLANGTHTWYNKAPYYYYGNRTEISSLLQIKDKRVTDKTKYPCIILEQPFKEVPTNGSNEVNLRFLIATKTNGTMTYKQRYESNFKTVLYPLYDSLISAIKRSNNVAGYSIKDKIDIPFYTEQEVVSNDMWDVIDLRIEINLIENCKKNKLCQ